MFIWLSGPRSIATYSGIRHIVIIIIAMGGVLPHDGGGPGLLVSHTSTGFVVIVENKPDRRCAHGL
jgi:hypothetical protein